MFRILRFSKGEAMSQADIGFPAGRFGDSRGSRALRPQSARSFADPRDLAPVGAALRVRRRHDAEGRRRTAEAHHGRRDRIRSELV